MFQIRQCGDSERPRHVLRSPPHRGQRDGEQDQADRAPRARDLQVGGEYRAQECFISLRGGEDGINKQFVAGTWWKSCAETMDNLSWISRSRVSDNIQTSIRNH